MSMSNSVSVLGAVVLGLLLAATLDAAPYQELEPREGYVPVYIREGGTPLLEINPKLAEAFNEIDTQNLLEQANDELELEKKPDLILMSVDNGDSMLIAQPADQVMSEDEPMEVIAIVPPSTSQDESDIAEIPQANNSDSDNSNDDKVEEIEAPQPAENSGSLQLEEAKEAIRELVNVLEVEMLEKLSAAVTEQAEDKTAEEVEPAQQQPEAAEKDQPATEEEVAKVVEVLPEQPAPAALADSNDNDKLPQELATDVSTVDAFKTKEIDVKSVETEKIDVPEEEPADTVSTDE